MLFINIWFKAGDYAPGNEWKWAGKYTARLVSNTFFMMHINLIHC